MVRIALAADHNGVALKARLADRLRADGHVVEDLGAHGPDVVDYPPLCVALCDLVGAGRADVGIVVGGSGQGEVIACNKMPGIRAGLAYSTFAVEISRGHNDANVMVLGAKTVEATEAETLVDLWLATPFKGGVHADRVAQLRRLDGSR
jgi:ribose 5-phosphate isomerase B